MLGSRMGLGFWKRGENVRSRRILPGPPTLLPTPPYNSLIPLLPLSLYVRVLWFWWTQCCVLHFEKGGFLDFFIVMVFGIWWLNLFCIVSIYFCSWYQIVASVKSLWEFHKSTCTIRYVILNLVLHTKLYNSECTIIETRLYNPIYVPWSVDTYQIIQSIMHP